MATVHNLAVLAIVVITSTTSLPTLLAQDDLPEFGSFLDSGTESARELSRDNIGTQNGTGSGISLYQKFQECISAAEDQAGERMPEEKKVRDCFDSRLHNRYEHCSY